MEMMDIYLILKLDDLRHFMGGMLFLGFFLCIGSIPVIGVSFLDDCEEELKIKPKHLRIIGFSVLTLQLMLSFTHMAIPTTKQFLTMYGVSYVTNSEQVIGTADKAFEYVGEYLDQSLELLKDEKVGK